jgi:hypothetical protein
MTTTGETDVVFPETVSKAIPLTGSGRFMGRRGSHIF